MNFFEIDLNGIVKVALLGREHLIPPVLHKERKINVYIMYVVTNGTLRLEINGNNLTLQRGDVYIFNNGDYQKPVCSTECEYYYLHFYADCKYFTVDNTEYLEYIKQKNIAFRKTSVYGFDRYEKLKVGIMQRIHLDGNNFSYLIDKLEANRLTTNGNSFEQRVSISHNVANMFIKLEQYCEGTLMVDNKSNRVYNTVKNIADYINDNYSKEIGSAEIERVFSLNFDYANRIFKSIMGQSIVKYRNYHRIERAKYLLVNTQKDIAEIASSVGFTDKYYFCRYFTKSEGISPISFKNREKNYAVR